MNLILLSGGLGNQMFQYAFALASKKSNASVRLNDYLIRREKPHNGLELVHVFDLKIEQSFFLSAIVRIFRKLLIFNTKLSSFVLSVLSLFGIKLLREKGDSIYSHSYLLPQKGITGLWGYWQSEKYFFGIEENVRNTFSFCNSKLSTRSSQLLSIIDQKENSVSLHIRRGDFLSQEAKAIYGNICTNDYYKKAMGIIVEKVPDPQFFVFSDDIDWVKSNMDIPNATYVDWNNGADSWQDMCLMSNCKYNIIANSSFSWWGAWLNSNPDKIVIVPSRFLNTCDTPNIVPDGWIKILV